MEGKIRIDEVYLKLDRIEVSGGLEEERNSNSIQPISADEPPFELTDSTAREVALRIPPAMYDQLTFNLVLVSDPYQLVMAKTPANEVPDPEGGDPGTGNGGSDNPPAGSQDTDTNSDDSGSDGQNDGNQQGDGNHDGTTDSSENDSDGNSSAGETSNDHHKKDKDKGKHKDKGKDHQGHRVGGALDRETSDAVMLDDFFEKAKPGMMVMATYENNGKTIHLIFAGSGIETLSVPARQGDSPMIIIGDNNRAEITFDPERWFSSLRPEDIESGAVQMYQGQTVLFIHRVYNSALFDALRPRVQESADLNFGENF